MVQQTAELSQDLGVRIGVNRVDAGGQYGRDTTVQVENVWIIGQGTYTHFVKTRWFTRNLQHRSHYYARNTTSLLTICVKNQSHQEYAASPRKMQRLTWWIYLQSLFQGR